MCSRHCACANHRAATGRPHLDAVGIGLLTLVVLSVLLPVAGAALRAVWAAAGTAAIGALVLWERGVARRGAVPILLPALVRSRRFVLGIVVAMCWFGSTLGTSVVVTLALQEGLGLSPLVAGFASGRVWGRESILDMMEGDRSEQPECHDMAATRLAADVVLLTYRSVAPGRTVLRSSLWRRRDGGPWRVCFHQGTPTT